MKEALWSANSGGREYLRRRALRLREIGGNLLGLRFRFPSLRGSAFVTQSLSEQQVTDVARRES